MNVYNQLILSEFNESFLNQLTVAATFRNDSTHPSNDFNSSANDIDVIANKSKTATMSDASNDRFEQMNQQNNENHLTNNILHEINRQFLSALLQKGIPKTTTEHNKQNVNLNPLTPPQTPITIATTNTTNTSFGGGVSSGNPHASNTTSASQSMAANLSKFNENCPATNDAIDSNSSSHRKRKRPTANRSNKRRRNIDVSSTDETDPDIDSDGNGNGDDRFDHSDISSDTEHDDKSNCSDEHDSSNLSKIGMGFGENETSFDSVSTIPAGNSLLVNSSSGSSKTPVGSGLNLVADKDKLNLLKLISLQSDENKLIGE